jgi:hypothetical protein
LTDVRYAHRSPGASTNGTTNSKSFTRLLSGTLAIPPLYLRSSSNTPRFRLRLSSRCRYPYLRLPNPSTLSHDQRADLILVPSAPLLSTLADLTDTSVLLVFSNGLLLIIARPLCIRRSLAERLPAVPAKAQVARLASKAQRCVRSTQGSPLLSFSHLKLPMDLIPGSELDILT